MPKDHISVSNSLPLPLLKALESTSPPSTAAGADSADATFSLIRRTLCSHNGNDKGRASSLPIEELLPPLSSSNDVDLQLYALISIIIREFVQSWYSKITPDHVFVEEVIQIIAHCTRALEQRLRKVDLEALLLDEIPGLIDTHISTYRTSHSPSHASVAFHSDPRHIYHTLHPHPALSPVPLPSNPISVLEQQQNDASYRRLLVQGALAILLPTEDLENSCLRTFVREVLSEMILGSGLGKVCEGWFLWEAISKLVEIHLSPRNSDARQDESQTDESLPSVAMDSSIHASFSPVSSHTQELVADGDAPTSGASKDGQRRTGGYLSFSFQTFLRVLQLGFVALAAIRLLISLLANSTPPVNRRATEPHKRLPTRNSESSFEFSSSNTTNAAVSFDLPRVIETPPGNSLLAQKTVTLATPPPILMMRAWSCLAHLLELESRMPWLCGVLSFLQWSTTALGLGARDGIFDKFLSHTVESRVLAPKHLPSLLRLLRTELFPYNTLPSPRRVPSSAAEIGAIRQRCARSLLSVVPAPMRRVFFGMNRGGGFKAVAKVSRAEVQHTAYAAADTETETFSLAAGLSVQTETPAKPRQERQQGSGVAGVKHVFEADWEPEMVAELANRMLDVFSDSYCNRHLIYGILELVVVRLLPEMGERNISELMVARGINIE
ncbi:MAG: hypothetical protein M1829_003498 [Trizodia sp. TS-e1964]|nr:MAG: hypothetical protein M1829_003498 [Trizodia sp. TS-e1964]